MKYNPKDSIIYTKEDAFTILENTKKCNNLDYFTIYQDLTHPTCRCISVEIKGNNFWFDTIYLSFPSRLKYIVLALTQTWKPDEVRWVKKENNEIISNVNVLEPKPRNSKLRLWWD